MQPTHAADGQSVAIEACVIESRSPLERLQSAWKMR